MKLWLCRSEWTRVSDFDRSNRDCRDAPVVPLSPPRSEAKAGWTAATPPANAIALTKVRRSSPFMVDILHPPIRNQPDTCDQDVQRHRDPTIDERDRDRRQIEQWRDLALQVAPDGRG